MNTTKQRKPILLTLGIAIFFLSIAPVLLTAQPKPWDETIGGGSGAAPVGGGAPLTGGLLILLSLGLGYGMKKIHDYRKRILE